MLMRVRVFLFILVVQAFVDVVGEMSMTLIIAKPLLFVVCCSCGKSLSFVDRGFVVDVEALSFLSRPLYACSRKVLHK